ncbi:MAG: polysaccharide biosynthesis C-terminal domain-containing protein [Bacteroidales bacterium]|nr:polysaccharide biosynthesis C-terminal domain-containing protein [Bacteroidales bacterium]
MQRKFFTNLILLIFLNLLIKPLWFFGIEVGVQNAVGESTYGFYFVVLNLTLVLNILLDIGITNYNNKNIAQHHFLLQKHLGNIIAIRLILFMLYAIVVYSIAFILRYDAFKIYLLSVLIFNQFLSSFILYLRSNLSGLHLFKTDSLISILDKSLMIIIVGVLLWGNLTHEAFKIEWFVYAQTIAYLITFLITLTAVLRKSGKINVKFDYTFFIAFFKQSYPYALLILLMAFYNRFDSVLIDAILPNGSHSGVIEAHTGHFQAGVYAQAYRILDVASQFGFLFAALLLPIFAKMIKLNENISDMIVLSFTLIIVPAIIISVSSSVFSEGLMQQLYNSGTEYSGPIFSIIILGFIAISSTYIFGTLLTANGSLKALNIMAIVGIVVNLVINITLIPHFEALGAAYSSIASQSITAIAQVLIAYKIFRLRINYKLIFKLVVLAVVTWLTAHYAQLYIKEFWLAFIGTIVFTTAISMVIKLLNIKDLFRIVRDSQLD